MRKNIVAGNWKMNKTLQEGLELTQAIKELVENDNTGDTGIILAPPFTHLADVSKSVEGTKIEVSAQNCASEPKGAFTGEVSPEMIASTGAKYTIIGHSERRSIFHEDDAVLNQKTNLAIENGLTPIFCCGESLEEREANRQSEVVRKQLTDGLFSLSEEDFRKVVLAYEPVWAIGTGKTATSDQAQDMHKFIRDLIAEKYGNQVADDTTILYGGSCKPSNANELFSNPDVDGGLIGGASLKADDFFGIITAF